MAAFADSDELIQFARNFLRDRTGAFQRDVSICTDGATAACPAILYFQPLTSSVLYSGATRSRRRAQPTGQTITYSLSCTFQKTNAHSCGMFCDNGAHHLELLSLAPRLGETVTSGISLETEERFEISIRHLMSNVVDSVHASPGYLHTLASDANLQKNSPTL